MPPKTKINEEMIVSAAVEVVRQKGFENVNARTVSEQLHCSTQPVMYHFSTIENLKRAAYRKADKEHSEYLMNAPQGQDPILAIGLNYIRFAVEEPQLFRFLFQSGYAEGNSLLDMIESGRMQLKTVPYSGTPSPFAHSVILSGFSDIVLMEDRTALLKELHRKVLYRAMGAEEPAPVE